MVPLVEGPGIAVDTTNRSNVVAFFNNVYLPSTNVPIGWTGSISGCVPGITGQAYTDATVQRVNYYRAMAGLPANIVLNTSLTDLGLTPSTEDQSAALMMSAQNALSHAPPTNWACYTALGAQAAGKSNIALGAAGATRLRSTWRTRVKPTPLLVIDDGSSIRRKRRSAAARWPSRHPVHPH